MRYFDWKCFRCMYRYVVAKYQMNNPKKHASSLAIHSYLHLNTMMLACTMPVDVTWEAIVNVFAQPFMHMLKNVIVLESTYTGDLKVSAVSYQILSVF